MAASTERNGGGGLRNSGVVWNPGAKLNPREPHMRRKEGRKGLRVISPSARSFNDQQWLVAEAFKATVPREDGKVQEPERAWKRCAQGLEHDLYRERKSGESGPVGDEVAIDGRRASLEVGV
jgi:hypothetical protein